MLVLGLPDHRTLEPETDPSSQNPFIRYRRLLGSYRAAAAAGADVTDGAYVELVERLDADVAAVWGHGFVITPTVTIGSGPTHPRLLVKDETVGVSGSHKARHLFGLALWLAIRAHAGSPDHERLAIASCGNAALAAAVVARALDRPLDVFVPVWADPAVLADLVELGAHVQPCRASADVRGDPCVRAFRAAVSAGSLPFGCTGPDNALTLDGGRTLGWELAESLASLPVDRVLVQIGGGALASSLMDGLWSGGWRGPVTAVQTEGCAPFDRAWRVVGERGLDAAVADPSIAMWPWETEPVSAATGILDDETYDWASVASGLLRCEGSSRVVTEAAVVAAHDLAHRITEVDVDATGSAGLAAAVGADVGDSFAVVFTGVTRR